MSTTHLSTGTAADILGYTTFHHVTRNADRLTRVPTANQELIARDWDGELYVVKFDKNFSKKHLFTFSKQVEATKLQAQAEALKPGRAGQDAENWHKAEIELLKNKIVKNLDKRAVADICDCGHRFNMHLTALAPKVPCPCREGGCACTSFRTPYGIARTYVGKPTEDPLSGAKTNKNTCIILNWLPKAEFEQVVIQSIQAYEKPAMWNAPGMPYHGRGWQHGDPLGVGAHPDPNSTGHHAQDKDLRWDFTLARSGSRHPRRQDGSAPHFHELSGLYGRGPKDRQRGRKADLEGRAHEVAAVLSGAHQPSRASNRPGFPPA